MRSEKTTDAVVDRESALLWAEVLLHEPAYEVIERALDSEPYVLGFSLKTARDLTDRLRKRGVPEAVLDDIFHGILTGGAYSIELMQRGYRQLWAEVIEPAADNSVGGAGMGGDNA